MEQLSALVFYRKQMKIDKIKTTGAAVIAALCLFVLVFGEKSICFFRLLIGIPCPGCGMTRALCSALHLNFEKAFLFHPLWPLVPPAAVYVLYKALKRQKIKERYIFIVGCLFVIVYIIRMFMYFPHTEPMTFNSDAIYLKLYDFVVRGVYGK